MEPSAPNPDPAGEPKPDGEPKPPPLMTTVTLQVCSFFLAALLGISFGASCWLAAAQWFESGAVDAEALRRIFEGGEDIDPMLGLWLRLGTLPITLLTVWFFVRRLDGQSLRHVGVKWPAAAAKEALPAGLAAAGVIMLWWLTVVPWTESKLAPWPADGVGGSPGLWGVLALALMFLLTSFQDELIFRGYIYTAFRERFSWVHAAGFTNLLMVSLYLGHPHLEGFGLLNLFLLGVVLSAMREKTGGLWMPSLFMATWNLVQGSLLSLPVIGALYPRLFDHRLVGSDGITGGSAGLQGSWVLVPWLLVLVAAAAIWTERRPWQSEAGS